MCDFYGVAKKRNVVQTEIDLLRSTFENGGDDLPSDLMRMLNFIELHKRVLSVMNKVLHISVTGHLCAQAEWSFSAMMRIKNFLRSRWVTPDCLISESLMSMRRCYTPWIGRLLSTVSQRYGTAYYYRTLVQVNKPSI